MSDLLSFDRRLRHISRKHSRISSNGYAVRLRPDGLVTMVPRRRAPRFPLGAVVGVLAVAFAFKAVLLASMGSASYELKLADMASSGMVAQVGAWVLQPDPLSLALARPLAPYL